MGCCQSGIFDYSYFIKIGSIIILTIYRRWEKMFLDFRLGKYLRHQKK